MDLKELYDVARAVKPNQALRQVMTAYTDEERRFFCVCGQYEPAAPTEERGRAEFVLRGKNMNDIKRNVKQRKDELGNLYAVYAEVCNRMDPAHPDKELLAIQRYLEHRFALDVMEEYGWEQAEDGKWQYVSNEEFSARYRAAMKHNKE